MDVCVVTCNSNCEGINSKLNVNVDVVTCNCEGTNSKLKVDVGVVTCNCEATNNKLKGDVGVGTWKGTMYVVCFYFLYVGRYVIHTPAASSVSCYQSCCFCSGLAYEIYSGGGPST